MIVLLFLQNFLVIDGTKKQNWHLQSFSMLDVYTRSTYGKNWTHAGCNCELYGNYSFCQNIADTMYTNFSKKEKVKNKVTLTYDDQCGVDHVDFNNTFNMYTIIIGEKEKEISVCSYGIKWEIMGQGFSRM